MTDLSSNKKKVIKEAYSWYTKVISDDMDAKEQVELEAWLQEDARHKGAYERAQLLWERVGEIDKNDLPQHVLPRSHTNDDDHPANKIRTLISTWFRPKGTALAGAVIAGLMVVVILSNNVLFQKGDTHQTDKGEIRTVSLDDGSEVLLGADSKIRVNYQTGVRHIKLLHGEAYFDVEADNQRPFTVDATYTNIEVVGTEFNVKDGIDAVTVAVAEGMVRVGGSDNNTSSDIVAKTFKAGQLIKVTSRGLSGIESTPVASIGAWRNGEMMYVNANLKDIMADAERYYEGQIFVLGNNARQTNLNMVFKSNDIDRLLQTLEEALPIEIHRWFGGKIIIIKDRSN